MEEITHDKPVIIAGAGLAGLAAAIALTRLKIPVVVVDKVRELRDAGSGMSVIGHSLILLEALGVDLRTLGSIQPDITFKDWRGKVVFHVPTMSDAELVQRYGCVQFNVHRGELHQALLKVFESEGGVVRTQMRLKTVVDDGNSVVASFENGQVLRGAMLIGADGIHSAARKSMGKMTAPRYSGYSCWRGFSEEESLKALPPGMYKTVLSPNDNRRVSFTCGTTTELRRFWALDIVHPPNSEVPKAQLKEFLLSHLKEYDPKMRLVVEKTALEEIIQTDVYDATPWPLTFASNRIALIGDAAHPVVHHFGQGACMAFEDAVLLAEQLQQKKTVREAIQGYDTWLHWGRCAALVMISRLCGEFYTTDSKLKASLLRLCLAWPLCLLFVLLIKVLLFTVGRPLRSYARRNLAKKK